MTDSTYLALATDLVTAPTKAFAALRERSRALLPVLVLIVGHSAVAYVYISKVDLGWMLETQIQQAQAANGAQITDAQRKQVVDAVARIPPAVRGTGAAIVANISVFLLILLSAVYYRVVSLFTRDGVTFGQWFVLTCWCMLPIALGQVATIVNLMINDARFMPQDATNPLSFGNLLSIDRTGATPMQRVVLSLDITLIWTVVLSVLGYQAFAKCSFVKAVTIALAPLAVIALAVTAVSLR